MTTTATEASSSATATASSSGPDPGSNNTSNNPPSLLTLDQIVRSHLEALANRIPETMSDDPRGPWQEYSLPEDVGEYLVMSIHAWTALTQTLADSKQLQQAENTFVKECFRKSRLAGLGPESVVIDTSRSKIRRIRTMTEKFAQEVQEVWNSPAGNPGSPARQT